MNFRNTLIDSLLIAAAVFMAALIEGSAWILAVTVIIILTGRSFLSGKGKEPESMLLGILVAGTLMMGRAFSITGFKAGPVPIYVTELVLGVLVLFALIKAGRSVRSCVGSIPKDIFYILILYLVSGVVYMGTGYSTNGTLAFRDIVFGQYVLFVPLVVLIFRKIDDLAWLTGYVIPASVGLFIIAMAKFFNSCGVENSVLCNVVKETKMFNLVLYSSFFVICLIASYAKRSTLSKRLYILGIYIFMLTVVLLQVRAGWLALVIALGFMGFLIKKEMKVLALLIPAVMITVVGIDAMMGKYTVRDIKEEMAGVIPGDMDSNPSVNAQWRLVLWKQIISQIGEKPVWGWGYGTQPDFKLWNKYKAPDITTVGHGSEIIPPHNHGLAILFKTGIFGFLLFFALNLRIFLLGLLYLRKCKNEVLKRDLYGLLCSLVCWHCIALLFDVLESPPTAIFLWIILGMIVSIVGIDKRRGEELA